MELVYLWVEEYKNIKKQGFNFSPRFECKFYDEYDENDKLKDDCKLEIKKNDDCVSIFPDNINITAIVGEKGSGKSSLLELISVESIPSILIIKVGKSIIIKKGKEYCNNKIITNEIYFYDEEFEIKSNYVSLSQFNNEKISNKMYVSMNRELAPIGWGSYELDDISKNNKSILNLNAFLYSLSSSFDFILLKNKITYLQFNYARSSSINNFIIDNKNFINFENLMYLLISDFKCFDNEEDLDYQLNNDVIEKYISHIKIEDIKKIKYISKNIVEEEIGKVLINTNCLGELCDIVYLLYKTSNIDLFEIFSLNNKKEKIEFSSGELANLFYKGQISNNLDILLIDESDLYNHPNWQKRYINNLIKEFKNSHIILTSHSPFVLSDLPKENVIFLEKGIQKYPFKDKQTFGANIHTLLSDGFFMKDGLMGEFAKGKIEEIKKFYDFIQKFQTRINLNEKVKERVKEHYLSKKEKFEHIQTIIGEPFLQTVIKNYLDELELIFLDKDAIDLELEKIEERKLHLEKLKNAKN